MTTADGALVDLIAPSSTTAFGALPSDGVFLDLYGYAGELDGPLLVEAIRSRSRDASVLFGGGAGPVTPGVPPTVTNILPPSGNPIASYAAIQFDVVDPLGPFSTLATMTFSGGLAETVFAGGSFVPPYDIASSVVPITNGLRYTFRRGGGLFSSAVLDVIATGSGGGQASASAAYAVLSPTPLPSADSQAPTVANVVPAAGSTISGSTPLQFDVTDNSGAFRRIFVSVRFDRTGVEEVVFDGDSFRGYYVLLSSRSMISGGFHFSIRRSDGWTDSPSLKVVAIDLSGNEVAVL